MTYPYYSAAAILPRPATPVELPPPYCLAAINSASYLPDQGLVDAVNVALLLGQPLLVTGEAGTGKTQLAYHLAHQLGLPDPLKFETKSNSTARDLFYYYDHLRHFQAAQTGQGSIHARDYLTYNALGLAILRANRPEDIRGLVSEDFKLGEPVRSIVLIDEIDKAQRDFPNDILNEVEGMYFRIPELANKEVRANPDMRPLLVLTSNSEKHLPAAFLRRCIYYHIPFPDSSRLQEIVECQLGSFAERMKFLKTALELFEELRKSGLQKKPATAELLNWIVMLQNRFPDNANPLADRRQALELALPVLIKSEDDRGIVQRMIERS